MLRFIEHYKNETFDVLVVGGGITGASVAYEAAARGLKVALLEKKDMLQHLDFSKPLYLGK